MFQVYGSLSQWNYLRLQIWILDTLSRQWSDFEEINILNFSKILKFAIVFKMFEFFCPFFSSLADGLLEITQETQNSVEHFHCEIWKLFLNFARFSQISKISFLLDLFTNKARNLKVAESNQAKDGLTKPLPATDEANRSPVVWKQFARR